MGIFVSKMKRTEIILKHIGMKLILMTENSKKEEKERHV